MYNFGYGLVFGTALTCGALALRDLIKTKGPTVPAQNAIQFFVLSVATFFLS